MYASQLKIGKMLVDEVKLTTEGDFKLAVIHEQTGALSRYGELVKYLRAIVLVYKGKVIVDEYVDLMYVKNYLSLFYGTHLASSEPNRFFKLVEKKEGKKTLQSAQCLFDEGRFLSRAEAKTMLDMMFQATEGYSKKHLFMSTSSSTTTIDKDAAKIIKSSGKELGFTWVENDEKFLRTLIAQIAPIVTEKTDD